MCEFYSESAGMCNTEVVVRRCSVENMLLEISQDSQENACARVSFSTKLQALGLQLY